MVDLPVEIAEKSETEEQANVSTDNLKDARILLVEDNEINIYVVQLILEKAGCVVEVARDGKQAVEQFQQSADGYFKAILMDVRMPVMNGIEATREIRALSREDAKKIPVIAMTADAFDEERKQTLDAGMNYHLSKPINPQILYNVLSKYMG
ncbi:response regulator [Blautia sp. Sow4_E7]|uniref:response regulator n=1 Tax=Blautia sp. Sow4_E7 TaxID=3438749 RepID=UPI003F8DB7C0